MKFARAVQLTAGPLTATLHGTVLRDVRLWDQRVLDALYVAIRDTTWNTVAGTTLRQDVSLADDGFRIELRSRHRGGDIDFEWSGTISAGESALQFEFAGEARSEFDANRIGLCLIHPIELAGSPFKATTAKGSLDLCFPEEISSTSLATDISGLTYATHTGVGVRFEFSGAWFELEDHRNWTDPGWKTYSLTPPNLSDPFHVRTGDQISQRVSLQSNRQRQISAPPATEQPVVVRVGTTVVGAVPEVGLMTSSTTATDVLRAIRPVAIHVDLNQSDDWRAGLARVSGHAGSLGIGLTVTVVGSGREWLAAVANDLKTAAPLIRIDIVDANSQITQAGNAPLLRSLMNSRYPDVKVGGGSRLHFAQLNRMRVAKDEWDYVIFPTNPQVHHSDDISVMATVLAQPSAIECARRVSGGLPVHVGPVSLRQRRNPLEPATTSDPTDQRELGPFGAAWLLASIAAMHDAKWLTVLWDLSGRLQGSPTLEILREVSKLRGLPVLETQFDPRLVGALAVRVDAETTRLLVANLTADELDLHADGSPITLSSYGTATVTVRAGRRGESN